MLKVNNDQYIDTPDQGDAGYDLRTPVSFILHPKQRYLVDIPLQWEPPTIPVETTELFISMFGLAPSYVGFVKPRSGLAIKHGVDVLAGVIDSSYRGNFGVVLYNSGNQPVSFQKNDRIAQLVIQLCFTGAVNMQSELTDSTRGAKGFGSSGTA